MKRQVHLLIVTVILSILSVSVSFGSKGISPSLTDFELLNQQYSKGQYTFSPLDVELNESEQTLSANQNDNSSSSQSGKAIEESNQEVEQFKGQVPRESVLNLIPSSAVGVVYCPSLFELDEKINNVYAELVPQAGPAPELLAQFLADTFVAGFESLAELEDIGLDLDNDFAVFLTSFEPPSLGAIVHLTDPDTIREAIDSEAEDSEPIEYNGITYWNSDEGSYAILDEILVYAQYPEVCENVIDIKTGNLTPISQSMDYSSFISTIMDKTEQVVASINLQSIMEPFIIQVQEEFHSTIDGMESDPDAAAVIPFIKGMSEKVIGYLVELNSVSVSLQIEETDVLLSQHFQFKKDGKIQQAMNKLEPDELTLISDLPNEGFSCGGIKANFEIIFEMSKYLIEGLSFFKSDDNSDDVSEMIDHIESIVQDISNFNDTFSNEMSFSTSYSESLIPDYLYVFELKNEEKLKTYMDERFLSQIEKLVTLLQENIEDAPQLSMFDDIQYGNSIMHNEVEIKSIVFPNFGDAFIEIDADATMFLPQEWEWSYAFADGRFYFGLGGPQQIQDALDSKAKIGESLAENISYQRLIEKLGADNNVLYGFSPVTMANSVMSILSEADPNIAAQMQMLSGIIDGIDENYSIGFAAKIQDGGIGGKLVISLGDFKQLIQRIVMLSGMDML